MDALQLNDNGAPALATQAALSSEGHGAAQLTDRNGSAFAEHRGRESKSNSVEQGLAAAAKSTRGTRDEDEEELVALQAQSNARRAASQFRKRSGSACKIFRGKGSNPNSVDFGLAAAARSTYVCAADGCQALVGPCKLRFFRHSINQTGVATVSGSADGSTS